MVNVFFFDLRDANTNNFENLSDDNFLLWDKKSNKITLGDYCIVYYQKKGLVLITKVVANNIIPQQEDRNWFVEYGDKKYYFISSGNYDEFIVFEILNQYTTELDFTLSIQGGITLITSDSKTKFKENKLPKLCGLIKDNKIKNLICNYSKKVRNNELGLLKLQKQVILYGPPGTGKTYNTKNFAVKMVESS